jgi:predicted pyridoxine 5'-phosphate oxidase superfamily flavin-nucleotide-binding protein
VHSGVSIAVRIRRSLKETLPMSFDPERISFVENIESVRAQHPPAMTRATGKVLTRLDKHCIAILAKSTFCVIGTHGPSGADVSPRGDPPGFVRVLDERHLLLPDRVGNNRFDSMANVFLNPQIGLLFFVPGMSEALRVNGLGRVTDDAVLWLHRLFKAGRQRSESS